MLLLWFGPIGETRPGHSKGGRHSPSYGALAQIRQGRWDS